MMKIAFMRAMEEVAQGTLQHKEKKNTVENCESLV